MSGEDGGGGGVEVEMAEDAEEERKVNRTGMGEW